jgi:hypothetical protein
MVRITVRTLSPLNENKWSFHVQVTENDGSKTSHGVSMDKEYYKKISAWIIGPEDFVRTSFEFLLKREDRHSILKEFNIKQISEYFHEYETEIIKTIHES